MQHNIDISYSRGQQELSPLADFLPCSVPSFNLVGSYAAGCCKSENYFFDFIQSIYPFFSSSTHRWDLLKVSSSLSLSVTKWSAWDDTCRALNLKWYTVKQTVCDISENTNG